MMSSSLLKRWLYASSGAYLLALIVSLYFEFYYIALLPFALVVIWAAFFHLEFVLFFIVAATPLSINLEEMKLGGVGMALPTEPLLFGVLLLFLFKLISGKSVDRKILQHPLAFVIYAYITWMLLTTITSEMPLVSLKYVTTRMWFIASFFFLAAHLFKDIRKIKLFLLLYFFPLVVVIIYTIVRHSQYGFDKDSSHWVMEPLFKDHTSYGAVLAMFFPVGIGLLVTRKMNLLLKLLIGFAFVILSLGLVLSYTRAAWISVIGAAAILAVMILGIRLRTLLLSLCIAGGVIYLSWDDIQISLQRNKQESSDKLEEHVGSISNVSSDASNLERLNRWHCAMEMFYQRPIVGWGPGTYQFVYAPFQRSKDRTIISTNLGDGGNAHSEYLGPLCEQGVLGMTMIIVLLLFISSMSFRLFRQLIHRDLKILVASVYLGLMTYFIHGVLNNYLDTDKASVPFWGFMSILVAIDIYHLPYQNKIEKKKIIDTE